MSRPPRPSRLVAGVLQYRCGRCKRWKAVGKFYALPWQLLPYSRCKIRTECKVCNNAARVRRWKRRAGRGVG